MANDRVYLKCDFCGESKMMLKHLPGNLSTRDNGLVEWINLHAKCHAHINDGDLQGISGFSVMAESLDGKRDEG